MKILSASEVSPSFLYLTSFSLGATLHQNLPMQLSSLFKKEDQLLPSIDDTAIFVSSPPSLLAQFPSLLAAAPDKVLELIVVKSSAQVSC